MLLLLLVVVVVVSHCHGDAARLIEPCVQ